MPHKFEYHPPRTEYPTPGDGLERPPHLINRKPSPNFQVLCAFFDWLRDKPDRRRDLIERFLDVSD